MTASSIGTKRTVYFNEYNVVMENAAYLPLVSGLLRAYAETFPDLTDAYAFAPFFFLRDEPDHLAAQHEAPDVACFSTSMWNEQFNLAVAQRVKALHPGCLVVFGGPQVPHKPEGFFEAYPFVDVVVRGEGEIPFCDVLRRNLESRDFTGIPNVAWRRQDTGETVFNAEENPLEKDLDIYESPYLNGYYEDLFAQHPGIEFQVILETNRGCPFLCAFCYWGQGGLSRKFRWHGIDRLRAEIEWCAHHKIRYVFNADSNFGMHKRDAEIAEILAETKRTYGFPDKYRTCFGKNTDERIFAVANILHGAKMEKGITLSRQSMNEQVLINIERANIKLSTYKNLQERFNTNEVPVYTELILGLPGETYQSWVEGVEELLQSGLKNQLFVYPCQVLPNTTLADPDYQKKFGVVTSRIPLTEIHGAIRDRDFVTEFEDIIVQTDAMPQPDWRRAAVFSWVTMTLHSLKLGMFIQLYLVERLGLKYTDLLRYVAENRMPEGVGNLLRSEVLFYEGKADDVIEGRTKACILREFGGIYWDVEEASFLKLANDLDRFYAEFIGVLKAFLQEQGIGYDANELEEVVRYQRMRISSWDKAKDLEHTFSLSFPEYFDALFHGKFAELQPEPQRMWLSAPKDFAGDKVRFAREVTLWGRKSDAIMEPVQWSAAGEPARTEVTA